MNEHFVNIKVDREERPDVDALYMDAVQALAGNGGWPMTLFLTPDAAPFYAGTYFPPQDRYGMPGFPKVLRAIANMYATHRDDVERQAEELRNFYQQRGQLRLTLPDGMEPGTATVDPDVLYAAADRLLAQIDAVNGGFGRAPKFPHPMGLEYLLRIQTRLGHATQPEHLDSDQLLRLVRLTLDKMAEGGIYDHLGGGFHRYSTDTHWLVPHFEKMLYDNALLAPAYLHAWQLTGEDRYRRVCEETLDYVLREMTDPSGGFYSTQDADSEGEEGKFYVWTPSELRDALGEDDAEQVMTLWGVTERGNFEGQNILHLPHPLADVAASSGRPVSELSTLLDRVRPVLYATRARRVWPSRDDKVLTSWNAFMQRAFAEAGRALDRPEYIQAATRNAQFLTTHLNNSGRLLRTWRDGRAKLDAYLEDYAALINALLTTYEATGDTAYFTGARTFADSMLDRFWDEESGLFYDTAHDHERLIGRPRELTDGSTPCGNSLAVEALLRLAAYTGTAQYREVAARVLVPLAPAMADQPSSFSHFLCALDDLVGPFYEIAIIGSAAETATRALLSALAARYMPRSVLAAAAPDDSAASAAIPLLEGRSLVRDQPAAYVCQSFVCRQPVTDQDDLIALLMA